VTTVLSPCAGRLLPLAEVPDPVFAAEMVGPGIAIDPEPGDTTVVSPISGTAVKVHPHAFVVVGGDGTGVLVHLGINTVRLEGRGFEVLAEEGGAVEQGAPMVRWDPSSISGPDMSPVVVVVALDRPPGSVPAPEPGTVVVAGARLFVVEASLSNP
jgi:glucose-specific phosphotransferase system IIA component